MAHPNLWGTTDTRNGLPTTTRESPDFSHGECQNMPATPSNEDKIANLKERIEYAEQELIELDAQIEADKAQLEGIKQKLKQFSEDEQPDTEPTEESEDEQVEVDEEALDAVLDDEDVDNTQAALIQREANLVSEIVAKQMRKVALQRKLDSLRSDLATAQYDDGTGGVENVND